MTRSMVAMAAAAMLALGVPAAAQRVSDAEGFLQAVHERDGTKVTEMIESRPTVINGRNSKGETALNVTIERRDGEWARFLLSKGAKPDLAAGDGETPLIAASRVGFVEAATLLLSLGADANAANRRGETALIVAVQARQPAIVKMLLQSGANPDVTDTVAGYSARDYAKRDTRSRQLLSLIEEQDSKPKTAAKPKAKPANDLDSFDLGN